jgi:hypothetical protein
MLRLLRERVAWTHPEWWALGLSGAAWVTIAASALAGSENVHRAHVISVLSGESPWVAVRGVCDWMLMVVAMMFPFTVGAVQLTAARSLWRRRHRAIVSWLAGYSAPWLLLGMLARLPVVTGFAAPVSAGWVALAFGLAAVWQTTDRRARALNACHRTWPLAPAGWRATRDCARAGWATSTNCVTACGPLMVACSLLGHGPLGLAVMVGATTVTLVERYSVRPDSRLLGGGIALHALVALAFV